MKNIVTENIIFTEGMKMRVENHKVIYSFFDKILNKIHHSIFYNNSITCAFRRRKLNNTDFTIISNNCWGGICYEYFGLQKQSPTVGCYFFSDDYIKFINNLHFYFSQKLNIISAKESKHYDSLKSKNEINVPIGKLGDIEVIFLHYKTPQEALDKWNRRCKRINWNNLIIKYSNMNEATVDNIIAFSEITIANSKKLLLLNKDLNLPNEKIKKVVYHLFPEEENLLDDTFYWKRYFNIYDFINTSSDFGVNS